MGITSQKVRSALEAMVIAGDDLAVSNVARHAGVSRRFVYDHPELRAEIERHAAQVVDRFARGVHASARVTGASLKADLENANAANRRLQAENAALRRRLSAALGEEVLAEYGTPLVDRVGAERQRIEDLEQKLHEETEHRRRLEAELEAARALNHEYLARLNNASANGTRKQP